MEKQTYVLLDEEVKLTGRTAMRAAGSKTQELVEVTPVNESSGTWKRWVSLTALFKVNPAPD